MSVFRRQLLDKSAAPKLGRLALTYSPMAMPVACVSALLVLVLFSLAIFGQVNRKATAVGILVPEGGLLTVRANEDGVIANVLPQEGERVTAGQLLVHLRFERESENVAALPLTTLVQQQLDRERIRLIDEQLALESGELARKRDVETQIARLLQRIGLERSQYALKQREHQQASALYQRMKTLGNGSLSLLQVQQYEMNVLAAESTLNEAQLRLLASDSELADLKRDLSLNSPQYGARASELSRAIAENAQEIARNANQSQALIRAPQAGVATAIAYGAGQSVDKGARLLSLIPDAAALDAEIWVPSEAAADLRLQATVSMQLLAFPQQKFGRLSGRISDISGAAISPEEVQQRAGIKLEKPAYRVLVKFTAQDLPAGITQKLLKPGMPLQAEIALERRSLWRALLGLDAPLLQVGAR